MKKTANPLTVLAVASMVSATPFCAIAQQQQNPHEQSQHQQPPRRPLPNPPLVLQGQAWHSRAPKARATSPCLPGADLFRRLDTLLTARCQLILLAGTFIMVTSPGIADIGATNGTMGDWGGGGTSTAPGIFILNRWTGLPPTFLISRPRTKFPWARSKHRTARGPIRPQRLSMAGIRPHLRLRRPRPRKQSAEP